MAERWCGRCRRPRAIEWSADFAFGPRAESARCPVCGAVWGVREHRQGAFQGRVQTPRDEVESVQRIYRPLQT